MKGNRLSTFLSGLESSASRRWGPGEARGYERPISPCLLFCLQTLCASRGSNRDQEKYSGSGNALWKPELFVLFLIFISNLTPLQSARPEWGLIQKPSSGKQKRERSSIPRSMLTGG